MNKFFHRGSWIPKSGVQKPQDILSFNDLNGESIYYSPKPEFGKSYSWQPYFPDETKFPDGYECIEYAMDAAKLSDLRRPVLLGIQMDQKAFEKYRNYLTLVVRKDRENDLSSAISLQHWKATRVKADTFTFDEFTQYQGELFMDQTITGELESLIKDFQLEIFPIKDERYWQFVEALREGKRKPLFTSEQILEVFRNVDKEGSISRLEGKQ